VPRAARVRLWLLLGYLAIPIDLVPDFVPVLGYADDAIIVSLVLRSVVRPAGTPVVRGHWPGSDDGLAALGRLTGLQLTEPSGGAVQSRFARAESSGGATCFLRLMTPGRSMTPSSNSPPKARPTAA